MMTCVRGRGRKRIRLDLLTCCISLLLGGKDGGMYQAVSNYEKQNKGRSERSLRPYTAGDNLFPVS